MAQGVAKPTALCSLQIDAGYIQQPSHLDGLTSLQQLTRLECMPMSHSHPGDANHRSPYTSGALVLANQVNAVTALIVLNL